MTSAKATLKFEAKRQATARCRFEVELRVRMIIDRNYMSAAMSRYDLRRLPQMGKLSLMRP